MCGIAGFYNSNGNYMDKKERWCKILLNMNKVQKNRGPDDNGTLLSDNCGMAHVRLSIIDLINGQQPMATYEDGKMCAIIHNGEIYNMNEIKTELKNENIQFSTDSDTEVILRAYLRYGKEFVKKLNGIFATAIFDERTDKLLLLRDHIGVKPLFYTLINETLVFSSEIKGLFEYPGFKAVIDDNSMREVLGLGPAKTYGKGVFKDVYEVLPGNMLEFSNGRIKESVFWKLESVEHVDDFDKSVEKVRYLIQDAVKLQKISDVPICTFLSGGVDSSLVTSICSSELQKENKVLDTFSFDFVDNDKFFKANSFQSAQDRPWVEMMVEAAKSNHKYLECSNSDQIANLYKCVDARDLPCMADIEASMMYFCKRVSEFNKVVLTGECADEIFGGYPWFHKKECFDSEAFPWSMNMEPRECFLKDDVIDTLKLGEYTKNAYYNTINETPVLPGENAEEKRRREIAYLNLKWFMVTLLDRMDRTSMYCGLEARVPFADYRIVEYVFNVPWEFKNYGGVVKGLLRKAGEGFLPDQVLYRKKCPYPKTYDPMYEQLLMEQLTEVINDPNASIKKYIDKRKTEMWMKQPGDYGKPFYGQLMAKPQQIAYLLQIDYWLSKY